MTNLLRLKWELTYLYNAIQEWQKTTNYHRRIKNKLYNNLVRRADKLCERIIRYHHVVDK